MSSGRTSLYPRLWDAGLRAGLAAAALFSAAWFTRGAYGLPLDDSYIHLTFARNLSQGLGFFFNPGEFSLGFSSPLWVMLLALIGRLGGDLVLGARLLGQVFFSLSCVLVFDLVRLSAAGLFPRDFPGGAEGGDRGRRPLLGPERWSRVFGVFAGLGLAASGNLLWLSGSGMEAMLFLCLGMASILLLRPEAPRPVAGGVALGLLVLTRPTGGALWVILAVWGLASSVRRREISLALIISLLMAVPWFIFSLIKTGYLLPPTRAGKLASDLFNAGLSLRGIKTYVIGHLDYLWTTGRGVVWLTLFGLIAWIGRGLVAGSGRERPVGSPAPGVGDPGPGTTLSSAGVLALWAVVHFGLHALLFRSTDIITPCHYLRYQVMLIPGAIAFSSYALYSSASSLSRARPARGRAFSYSIALLFVVAPLVIEVGHIRSWQGLYARNVDQLQKEHRAAAEWAGSTFPDKARIACLDIGLLGFYSGRYVIDLGGLIDPGVHPYLREHRTGPYLVEKGATHYLAMVRHDSERITGVKADAGRLYHLRFIRRFDYPQYYPPVFTHSLGIEIYEISGR